MIPTANSLVEGLTGVAPGPLRHWVVAFAVPFVVLLPATAAMGATLPAMDRLFCSWRDNVDYIAARNLYLRAEMQRVVGNESEAIDDYVASVRKCREFGIGYMMAMSIAENHVNKGDSPSAERILQHLIDVDPSRPEAVRLQSLIRQRKPGIEDLK